MSWNEENDALVKEFKFKDFTEAMTWMVKASYAIEKLNHHPEWANVYNTVFVRLTTHDAGEKVTSKDRELAEILDSI